MIGLPIPTSGILAIGVTVAVASAYGLGRHHGADACLTAHQAALAESLQRGLEQAQEIARQDAEVSEYYERLRQKTIVKVEEVTREIPSNCAQCGIGPNGLRLINEARGYDSSADAPVQPDGGLPPATQDRNGQAPGFGRPLAPHEPRLLRLRSEASPVGEADQGQRGSA